MRINIPVGDGVESSHIPARNMPPRFAPLPEGIFVLMWLNCSLTACTLRF